MSNYCEAADKLFVSQSSLSKHIKALENVLGVPLFDRTGRGVALNEYGEMFLPYARQMHQIESIFKKDFYNKLHATDNIIVIGTEYRITELLTDFRFKNKNYLLSTIEGNVLGEIKELLRNGKCELAFMCNLEDPDDEFIKTPYRTDLFVAVLFDSHPLASRKSIFLEELKAEDYIMMPDYSVHTHFCKGVCQQAGFVPKVVFTGSRGSDIVDFVKREMGISLLFEHSVESIKLEGISIIEIEPKIPFEVSICYRKNDKLSPGAILFLNYVKSL